MSHYIEPIETEDWEPVRKWRNAQMDILRQDHKITRREQKEYALDYYKDPKDRKLYSFLTAAINPFDSDVLIGYGGFVNINKEEKSAEISFLMDPKRKEDLLLYTVEWLLFLAFLRIESKKMGITTWKSETYMDTKDPTRAIHIHGIHAIFGAQIKIDENGNGRQEWKI